MANRQHKKKQQFKRVKPSAATVVQLAPRQLSQLIVESYRQAAVSALKDGLALVHDGGMYCGRILRKLFTRRARLAYGSATLIAIGVGAVALVNLSQDTLRTYSRDLNSPTVLMNEKNTGTTITDRKGVVLFQAYGAVGRHAIPFAEMPRNLKQATIAAEDPDFYKNHGFSWRGTLRAAYHDIIHTNTTQGGSTITQQLVKNTVLTNEKSLTRKYKEVLLSFELERRYDKNQILQMYLNTIYYGEGAYGIEAASETYYHKPARDLTLQESTMLAGLPQSPSHYDPNVNLKAATDRRSYVVERMNALGYIDTITAKQTLAQPIVAGTRTVEVKAPWFVFYVLDQLRQQYGQAAIEKGGLSVHTTLDYDKQLKAQGIVQAQVEKLSSHHVTNAGLVSISPRSGAIEAMVGSVDYNAPGFGQVNVTLAQLQPGSSFKPIAYLTAFEKGWNGATEVNDKPMTIPQGPGQAPYVPQNYDLKFRGPVTLRRALANSLNIPALQVIQYAGVASTIDTAHLLGIQSPSLTRPEDQVVSLVLGSGDVRPIDMARVYATFANGGTSVTPYAINKVTNKFGEDITKPLPGKGKQVVDPRYAYMLTNILSDNQARVEEFGANSPLQLSRPAAAKTGTTNDFRDNWTVGYTPDLVTAVWAGNNDHSPMTNVDGITGAAPIWHNYMEMALADTPASDFAIPAGVTFAKVCKTDGGLAAANDPTGYNEVFLTGQTPTKPCGWSHPGATPAPAPAAPAPTPPTAPATPAPIEAQAPSNPQGPGVGGGSSPPNSTPPQPPPKS